MAGYLSLLKDLGELCGNEVRGGGEEPVKQPLLAFRGSTRAEGPSKPKAFHCFYSLSEAVGRVDRVDSPTGFSSL